MAECKNCEKEGTKGYELGQVGGLQEASKILLEDAAGHFTNKRDDAAHLFRSMSQRLNQLADLKRKDYDKKYRGKDA